MCPVPGVVPRPPEPSAPTLSCRSAACSGPWQSPAAAGRCCAGRSEGRGSSRARNRTPANLVVVHVEAFEKRGAHDRRRGHERNYPGGSAAPGGCAGGPSAERDGSSLRGIGAVHQRLRQQWFKNGSLERGTSRTSCAARLPQRAHAQAQPDSASPRLPHGRGPNEGAAATAAEPDCTSDSATGSDSSAAAVIAPSSRSFCRCSSATGSKTQRHEQRSQLSRSMACHQSEHRHWNEELTSAKRELTTPTPAC